ncbi:MAG: hypothetical protein ABIL68_03550 [bacterium]
MGSDFSLKRVRSLVQNSIQKLINDDADLLDINVNERSISHKFAEYLQQEFLGWNVDCEYNRKMGETKRLNVIFNNVTDQDIEAKTVFPDIIVHRRQTDKNLLVIEMKKSGNNFDNDVKKLKAFTGDEDGYRFGLLLIINSKNEPQQTWFDDGDEMDPPSNRGKKERVHGK